MKIKTSELTGAALCYAVCMIEMPHLVWGQTIGLHAHNTAVHNPNRCYCCFGQRLPEPLGVPDMAMTKSPHNVFLPADDVQVNLHNIPSYFFLRIHVPTGHVYLDHFNDSHNVSHHDLERQVPSKTEALRLEELVGKWNKQAPGTWQYETCSLGDVHDIIRCEKMNRTSAAQADIDFTK